VQTAKLGRLANAFCLKSLSFVITSEAKQSRAVLRDPGLLRFAYNDDAYFSQGSLMANCTAINPAAGSAETMISTVDCYMQSNVQAGYASLLGPGSVFSYGLTIALTLYVAIVGYRLIFGRSSLSMGEMVPRMVLIGAVLALTSNWATYQVLVYDVLTDGPQEIVGAINPGAAKSASLNARIDVLSGRMVDLADAWTQFDARTQSATLADPAAPQPATPNATPDPAPEALPATANGITAFIAPKDSLGPNMLLISALLLVLASAGVLVVAKIILGILLVLGPVFAALGLFASTRGLTLGWARAAVLMALVPVMAVMTSAGAVALLEPLLTEMIVAAGQGVFSLRAALTILVVVIVMVAVSVQLFRVGRTIVGGWSISFGEGNTGDTAPAPAPMILDQSPPANMVFNERMQSLVGSIERTAQTSANPTSAVQRAIVLPPQIVSNTHQSRADANSTNRSVMRGRVPAVRAPIKAIRSAA
jgi:type IV secretion system protein VirB6